MPNPLFEILDATKMKLEIGSIIWNRFFNTDLDDLVEVSEQPPGWDEAKTRQDHATAWLLAMGFEQVEWYPVNDTDVLCALWYTDREISVNFMLEFMGPDGSDITLWEQTGEVHN